MMTCFRWKVCTVMLALTGLATLALIGVAWARRNPVHGSNMLDHTGVPQSVRPDFRAVISDCGGGKTPCQVYENSFPIWSGSFQTVTSSGICSVALQKGTFTMEGSVGPKKIGLAPREGAWPCDLSKPRQLVITPPLMGEFGVINWPGIAKSVRANSPINMDVTANLGHLNFLVRSIAIIPSHIYTKAYGLNGDMLFCSKMTTTVL